VTDTVLVQPSQNLTVHDSEAPAFDDIWSTERRTRLLPGMKIPFSPSSQKFCTATEAHSTIAAAATVAAAASDEQWGTHEGTHDHEQAGPNRKTRCAQVHGLWVSVITHA